jgi:hypothetical protein
MRETADLDKFWELLAPTPGQATALGTDRLGFKSQLLYVPAEAAL